MTTRRSRAAAANLDLFAKREMKPRLLDLFCGAGGCSVGYHRAGFDCVGVDNRPMPRYPYQFIQADALEVLADSGFLAGFDAVHASPPCQDHSSVSAFVKRHGTGWLLDATRQKLIASGLPYVIENVERADMPGSLILCGASFGLGADGYALRRHRRFESNVHLMGSSCACPRKVAGVYGHGETAWQEGRRGHSFNRKDSIEAMGINWMTRDELKEAIPPVYTQHIGEQLLAHLRAGVA